MFPEVTKAWCGFMLWWEINKWVWELRKWSVKLCGISKGELLLWSIFYHALGPIWWSICSLVSKPLGCGRSFETAGLEDGVLCSYSAGPAADSHFLGCCADLLLRNKLMPFSFSSSHRTVPDGRNNDTQNYPGEAHFLKSVSSLSPSLLHFSLHSTARRVSNTLLIPFPTGLRRNFLAWIASCLSCQLHFLTLPLPVFLELWLYETTWGS